MVVAGFKGGGEDMVALGVALSHPNRDSSKVVSSFWPAVVKAIP